MNLNLKPLLAVALVASFILSACNTEAMEPKFQRVENIEITSLSKSDVTLVGEIVLYNPNYVSVTMDNIELEVYVNDYFVGKINQNNTIEIAKRSDFSLPLSVNFDPKKLFADDWMGLIEMAAGYFNNKKFDVKFEGDADFKVKSFAFNIPIEYTEEITFNEK